MNVVDPALYGLVLSILGKVLVTHCASHMQSAVWVGDLWLPDYVLNNLLCAKWFIKVIYSFDGRVFILTSHNHISIVGFRERFEIP